jgi:GT2 family glycosyltransferase
MRISVITTSYNAAEFLPKCLASVHRQADVQHQHYKIEHIVTDAASTDATLDILRSDPYIRWSSEPDNGQSEGFNKGARRTDAEWICWLNADDELSPSAIASFRKTLERHPEANVIYGHVQFIDEQSRPLWTSYQLPYRRSLIANNVYVPPTSGAFFRRELLLREPLDPDYHYVMDVEWFLRCNQHINPVLSDHVFCHFRVSAHGKTSEMIKTGQITERHYEERERYRQKYIYSQWPQLSLGQAQRKLARRQRFYKIYYYWLKARYIPRYLTDRLFPKTPAPTACAPPSLKTEH